jgi:hypothetical protein
MRDPWEPIVPVRLRTGPARDPESNDLRVDADAVCPRCLSWIGPRDIVRRTAYGLVQHEHCPVSDTAVAEAPNASRELPFA